MSASHRERILVALSGGVDSSVAALLLKREGYDIVGAYMKNWINEDQVIGDCPWQQDIVDARAVADRIGIEFHVVNLMRDYRERIVDYLLDGYARGLTPNPDVMCNREIKFGVFRAWAKDHGFTAVATGHYARRLPAPPEENSVDSPTAGPCMKGPIRTRISPIFSPCSTRNSCTTPGFRSDTCSSPSSVRSPARQGW
jgi:tRNA-specific 2-thiouridylase